jgi:hypothetical protein
MDIAAQSVTRGLLSQQNKTDLMTTTAGAGCLDSPSDGNGDLLGSPALPPAIDGNGTTPHAAINPTVGSDVQISRADDGSAGAAVSAPHAVDAPRKKRKAREQVRQDDKRIHEIKEAYFKSNAREWESLMRDKFPGQQLNEIKKACFRHKRQMVKSNDPGVKKRKKLGPDIMSKVHMLYQDFDGKKGTKWSTIAAQVSCAGDEACQPNQLRQRYMRWLEKTGHDAPARTKTGHDALARTATMEDATDGAGPTVAQEASTGDVDSVAAPTAAQEIVMLQRCIHKQERVMMRSEDVNSSLLRDLEKKHRRMKELETTLSQKEDALAAIQRDEHVERREAQKALVLRLETDLEEAQARANHVEEQRKNESVQGASQVETLKNAIKELEKVHKRKLDDLESKIEKVTCEARTYQQRSCGMVETMKTQSNVNEELRAEIKKWKASNDKALRDLESAKMDHEEKLKHLAKTNEGVMQGFVQAHDTLNLIAEVDTSLDNLVLRNPQCACARFWSRARRCVLTQYALQCSRNIQTPRNPRPKA